MVELIPFAFLADSKWVGAVLIVVFGLLITTAAAQVAARITRKRISDHLALIIRKVIIYLGALIVISTALIQLEVNLTAFLGAAGIASVAVGFAAQTSLSNLISGIFLLSERPFQVGDLIALGNTRGVVMSIDLLSVKLRTLDNLYVRIPNSTIINSEVQTITRFPIRRMDINIGVAYREDVGRVMEILRDLADKNPFCLDEPAPLVLFKDFGSSSLDFLFGLWFEKTNFLNLRNSIMREIKERFDAEGIEIPFPHVTLYTGSETTPFPVSLPQPEKKPLPRD